MLRSVVALALALALLAGPTGAAPAPSAQVRGLVGAVDGVMDSLASPSANPGEAIGDALRALARAEGVQVAPYDSCPTLGAALRSNAARLGVGTPPVPLGLSPPLERAAACLLGALHEANLAMDATWKGVSDADLLRLLEVEDDPAPDLLELLAGRDHTKSLAAAVRLADAVALAMPLLEGLGPQPANGPPLLDLAPVLAIGSPGSDTFTKNYILTIDLGGDDTYDNHAGGIFVSVGNAFYDVEPGSGTQVGPVSGWSAAVGGNTQDADATLASSLVIDLGGNDTYGVKKAPMLKDDAAGCGTVPRVAIVGTIGSGVIGVGMLVDPVGDNTFIGRTQTQGAGHVFGVGVLYSGIGDDTYEAVRAAQGSGLLGGVGLHIDAGGDDDYVMAAPPGGVFNGDRRFCDDDARYGQGGNFDRKDGPFTPQFGILADLGGNDSYTSPHKSQGFSQGHGLGLLLDAEGDDEYTSGDRSQGSGHGRAIEFEPQAIWSNAAGLLVDLAGDDTYVATSMSQGWSLGTGTANPPDPGDLNEVLIWTVQRNEGVGVLLDGLGDDTYLGIAGRGDGVTVTDGVLGVFSDRD